MMRMLKVAGSNDIAEIGYDPIGKHKIAGVGTLDVVFKSMPNVVYRYEGVSPIEFVEIVSAESLGKAFHESFVKTKHPFTKSDLGPTLKK